MKKLVVNCNFGSKIGPFSVYIGEPEPKHHPIQFQANWLSKERGGSIPSDFMDSLANLHKLAKQNNVSFEELCVYAMNLAEEDNEDKEKNQKIKQAIGKKIASSSQHKIAKEEDHIPELPDDVSDD